jgi:hypothetical protein
LGLNKNNENKNVKKLVLRKNDKDCKWLQSLYLFNL